MPGGRPRKVKTLTDTEVIDTAYSMAFLSASKPPSQRTPEDKENIATYLQLRALQVSGVNLIEDAAKGLQIASKQHGLMLDKVEQTGDVAHDVRVYRDTRPNQLPKPSENKSTRTVK